MSDEQALATVANLGDLLPASTNLGLDVIESFASVNSYLPRMQLFTKGTYIDQGKIAPGHYGVISGKEVADHGTEIDVLVLAVRAKALDMSDRDNIISRYVPGEAEFERIRADAEGKNTSCQCGLSFLIYEAASNTLFEFFCGSKSAQTESKTILNFMAVTKEQAAQQAELGRIVEPRPMSPMTLKVRYIQKKFSWHVPVAVPCSTPIDVGLPQEQLVAQVKKFLDPKDEGGTEVAEDATGGRAV